MLTPLHVLIVEDSEDDAALLLRQLRRGGYEPVHERVDTAEAMRAALDRGACDVVIADYSLPRFSAPAALELLKERGLDLPFVIFSGSVGEDAAVEVIRAGAYDYVMKDRPGRLVTAVEHALREAAARRERRRAEEAQRLLSGAGALLASSLDYEATLRAIARLAVPQFADWCVVDVVQEDGRIRPVEVAAADPSKEPLLWELVARNRASPGWEHHPIAVALRTGQPQLLSAIPEPDLAAIACDDEHLRLIHQYRPRAVIAAPLTAQGRTLGVITFLSADERRRYGPSDLTLAEELARRAALALDNARLYREAQEAIRLRDEFLSLAAHELKTPLTALRGHVQLLARQLKKEGAPDPILVRRALPVLDQQSERLGRLVARLLDVSRLEGGRLTLERHTTDVVRLVEAAITSARALTSRHALVLRAPAAVSAVVDPLRLEQVLINLLDNAIKYSSAGGQIDVEVSQPDPDTVRIAVRDRGPGIAPAHRAEIFERFFQAQEGRPFAGLGLGPIPFR